jgi:hypothetical protein
MPEDPKLRTAEAAKLAGVQSGTWRAYVSEGRAPVADGHHDARSPWWFESTVNAFVAGKLGRGHRRAELGPPEPRAPRRVFTPEFKATTVQEFHASGQSIRQFALAHELTQSALAKWIREAEETASPKA